MKKIGERQLNHQRVAGWIEAMSTYIQALLDPYAMQEWISVYIDPCWQYTPNEGMDVVDVNYRERDW